MSSPLIRVWAVKGTSVLGQDDDRPSLRRLVGQAGELSGRRQPVLGYPRERQELGGLPVAQRDRAGLVEQQGRAVAGRLDRASRHGENVVLHQAVHTGDADGRQQRADRRRDEAHE
jgi:hypothetical protein